MPRQPKQGGKVVLRPAICRRSFQKKLLTTMVLSSHDWCDSIALNQLACSRAAIAARPRSVSKNIASFFAMDFGSPTTSALVAVDP